MLNQKTENTESLGGKEKYDAAFKEYQRSYEKYKKLLVIFEKNQQIKAEALEELHHQYSPQQRLKN